MAILSTPFIRSNTIYLDFLTCSDINPNQILKSTPWPQIYPNPINPINLKINPSTLKSPPSSSHKPHFWNIKPSTRRRIKIKKSRGILPSGQLLNLKNIQGKHPSGTLNQNQSLLFKLTKLILAKKFWLPKMSASTLSKNLNHPPSKWCINHISYPTTI